MSIPALRAPNAFVEGFFSKCTWFDHHHVQKLSPHRLISLGCRFWSVEENVIYIHFVCSSSETASSLLAIHIFTTPVTSSSTFCVRLIPFQRTHPVSKRAPSRVGGYGYLPIPKTRRVGTFWVYPHPVPTHFSGTSGWVPRWVHNPACQHKFLAFLEGPEKF